MGRKQFPLAAKLFQISKAPLSCPGTNPRLFQVFYVHTQAERAGGGLPYGACLWILQPSSRMGIWSALCDAHVAVLWRRGTRQVQIKKAF